MQKRKTSTTLAAVSALVAAATALAAGPSARAAGTPLSTCGQVVKTSVVLTQDLTCADAGIIVGASGITIDLKGHVMEGDYSDVGIRDLSQFADITIKNGVIRNFQDGVFFPNGADQVTLSNLLVSGNSEQGVYIEGAGAKVVSSTVVGNGQTGIQVLGDSPSVTSSKANGNGGEGIWLVGATPSVKSSSAGGNAADGISLAGAAAKATSLTVNGNGKYGLYVSGGSSSIASTTASGNGSDGIEVFGDAATLKGNRAEANGFPAGASDGIGAGIRVDYTTTPPVGMNVARGNDSTGECFPKSLCPVAGSKAQGSPISFCEQTVTTNAYLTKDLLCAGDSGIVVGASGITIDLNGHVLEGNGWSGTYGIDDHGGYDHVTIKNGTVRNFVHGLYATNGADNVSASNVVFSGNALDGAYVAGAFPAIASSTASGNGQIGLALIGDSASVSSSTAAGNGQYGIWATGTGTTVKSSGAAGNALNGVSLTGDSAKVTSVTLFGNRGSGISVTGNAASIKSTISVGNTSHGIYVDGDQGVLTGNRADGNGFIAGVSDGKGAGIAAGGYAIAPTGTNVAHGNDDPQNCSPAGLC